MHLTDKQIIEIMGLADYYAHVYSVVGDDTMRKARAKLLHKLINISKQADNKEPKPVYEYMWAAITNNDVMFVTNFYKTKKEARKSNGPAATILCRLKQSKREVKE